MPTRMDISIWRGNNAPPLVWSLAESVPLDGSEFFLAVSVDGVTILARDTVAGTLEIDPEARELRWSFTLAESTAIPQGAVAAYEIERHTGGTEITEFYGDVTGLGGPYAVEAEIIGAELDFSSAGNSNLQLFGWI